MDTDFIQARIDATKIQIVELEEAFSSLIAGGISEYLLDTGQNRTRVTKQNISSISKLIDSLYNRCATLEARLNGSGSIISRML